MIIKSGIDMLRETLSQILGEKAEHSLVKEIKETVCAFPEVEGAYDLILNNYGPDRFNGSVHIGVAEDMDADRIDKLIREITEEVYRKHEIIITAIGVYSVNKSNPDVITMRDRIRETVCADPLVKEMHAFYLDEEEKTIRLDLVISFDAKDRRETFSQAVSKVQEMYPDYRIKALIDTDFAEE